MRSKIMKLPGFCLCFLLFSAIGRGQDFRAATDNGEGKKALPADRVGGAINLVVEVFALPQADAASLCRTGAGDTVIYEALTDGLARGVVEQVLFQSIAARSGGEAVVRDGPQVIYPTAAGPPYPLSNPPDLKAYEEVFSPPTMSVLESKELGWSCQLLPEVKVASGLVTVEIDFVHQTQPGRDAWGWSPFVFEIPRFTRNAIRTTVVARNGDPCFLGSLGLGEPGENGSSRLHLAFLRVEVAGEGGPGKSREGWRLNFEVFALPLAKAAAMRREAEGAGRYELILQALGDGAVEQEEFLCLTGNAGAVGAADDVVKLERPSTYLPPGPRSKPGPVAWQASPRLRSFPLTPYEFENEETGMKVVAAVVGGEGDLLEARLAVREVRLMERTIFGEGMARREMPGFARNRLKTGVRLTEGRASLLGTLNGADRPGIVRWVFVTGWRLR